MYVLDAKKHGQEARLLEAAPEPPSLKRLAVAIEVPLQNSPVIKIPRVAGPGWPNNCATLFLGMYTEPPRAGIKAMTRDSESSSHGGGSQGWLDDHCAVCLQWQVVQCGQASAGR